MRAMSSAEIFEARHELFHLLPVELVEDVGDLSVMGFDRACIAAAKQVATQYIFQKIGCSWRNIANMQRALHDGTAQLWRQTYKHAGGEVRRQLGNDIGDDLWMLIGEIGLQALDRQSRKLYPDGFLNELWLNALFKHGIGFVLWQGFAQQAFKALCRF